MKWDVRNGTASTHIGMERGPIAKAIPRETVSTYRGNSTHHLGSKSPNGKILENGSSTALADNPSRITIKKVIKN